MVYSFRIVFAIKLFRKLKVLVLGGALDKITTGKASIEIAEKMGCELFIYDEYGHAAYYEIDVEEVPLKSFADCSFKMPLWIWNIMSNNKMGISNLHFIYAEKQLN